jgi:hypothetical protein
MGTSPRFARRKTVFIITSRSDAQSTLAVLRSVRFLKLYGGTALYALCRAYNAVLWNQRELATAMQRESTVECNECRARHSLRNNSID